jgi:two-component system, OmpR family, alkaline phosphatase synthesis response regulator PhoP
MSCDILVCDDETHIVRAVEFKLRKAGHAVRCAFHGEAAWDEVCRETPALIITDWNMPRLTGLELVQRVRQRFSAAELPIVLLTAKGLELQNREVAGAAQVQAVLGKPFSPRELLAVVESLLASRSQPA